MNQWWLTLNRLRLAFYRWQLMANHRLADDRMPAGTLREVRAPPPPLPRGFQGLASAGDPGAVGRDQYRQWRRLVGSVIEGTGWFAVRLMCVVPE